MFGQYCILFFSSILVVYTYGELLTAKQEEDAIKYINHEVNNFDVYDVESLNKCLERIMLLVKPYMKYGIKAWGVPVLDPLYLKTVRVSQNHGGTQFNAVFKDVLVYGLSDFKVDSISSYPEKYTFDLSLSFPALRVLGYYDIDGKILLLNLKDSGPFTANLTNVDAKIENKFRVVDGVLDLNQANVDFNFKTFKFYLENLLQGSPAGETINESLNQGVDELAEEFKPSFVSEFNKIVVQTLNKGLQNIPLVKWQAAIQK